MTARGCPLPPIGRVWGPARSSCAGGFAGVLAAGRRSGSAAIATGATGIAASDADKKTAATDAGRQPAAPAKRGGAARSPRPATGLPGTLPPPARDGSYFCPSPPIRQYQKPMDETAKKAALLGGISASAAIEAVSSRHPARLHCVWAHAGVIGPERGAVIDERNGSTARRCSRSKPRMNFGRRRRQVNRWNSRMNSLHPKEAHFDVWAKEEG